MPSSLSSIPHTHIGELIARYASLMRRSVSAGGGELNVKDAVFSSIAVISVTSPVKSVPLCDTVNCKSGDSIWCVTVNCVDTPSPM